MIDLLCGDVDSNFTVPNAMKLSYGSYMFDGGASSAWNNTLVYYISIDLYSRNKAVVQAFNRGYHSILMNETRFDSDVSAWNVRIAVSPMVVTVNGIDVMTLNHTLECSSPQQSLWLYAQYESESPLIVSKYRLSSP